MILRPTFVRLVSLVSLSLLCFASIGSAQTEPVPQQPVQPTPESDVESRAIALKAKGDAAMDRGLMDEALMAYTESYALKPDAAVLYNRARAYQKLQQYPQALEQLELFQGKAPPDMLAKVTALDKLFAEIRQRVATLTVSCNVPHAELRLRDRSLGQAPYSGRVNSGTAVLEISAEGYFPTKRTLELASGGMNAIDIQLVSKTTSGIVSIASPVAGAQVSIDGHPSGRVPFETTLSQGVHILKLSRDGYETTETQFVIDAGQTKTLDVPLTANKTVFERWWFWTGVAVIAGGVAVGVYAATTEKDPGRGTLSPGVVVLSRGLNF
jgi:hypothetical protein